MMSVTAWQQIPRLFLTDTGSWLQRRMLLHGIMSRTSSSWSVEDSNFEITRYQRKNVH